MCRPRRTGCQKWKDAPAEMLKTEGRIKDCIQSKALDDARRSSTSAPLKTGTPPSSRHLLFSPALPPSSKLHCVNAHARRRYLPLRLRCPWHRSATITFSSSASGSIHWDSVASCSDDPLKATAGSRTSRG